MTRILWPLLVLALWVPIPVQASHYDLSGIDLVEDALIPKLAALGVQTTEDLWKQSDTPKGEKKLAKALGVTRFKVKDLHDFCDVLRVQGVGPKVVRVLRFSGVTTLKDLAKKDPAKLTEAMKTANVQYDILGKLPDEATVKTWIDQAVALTTKGSPDSRKP